MSSAAALLLAHLLGDLGAQLLDALLVADVGLRASVDAAYVATLDELGAVVTERLARRCKRLGPRARPSSASSLTE